MSLRDAKKGQVSVRIGYPISNVAPERFARLEVVDDVSGTMILEADIPAAQLLLLMSTSTVTLQANVLVPFPERVGKPMELAQEFIPDVEWQSKRENEEVAEDRARVLRQEWDLVQISRPRGNRGHQLTMRRWRAAPEPVE